MCNRPMSLRRGFTLAEILVVVVILGIAGGIIVPQIGTRDDRRAQAAARSLIADLIYAQNLAITSQDNHLVMFSTSASPQRYMIVKSSDMSVVQHPMNRTPYIINFGANGTSAMKNITLVSANIKGTSGSSYTTIGFDELGTPLARSSAGTTEPMASGAIVVRCGQFSMEIDIEPFTGQISVKAL
ncbi:MAG: Tfp pilus assembly protein FimT/FimU [Bacillota bacterium]